MTQLDPIFATNPFATEAEARESSLWIEEQIASLEEDVREYEQIVAENLVLIPKLERESLERQRDAAIAKLKIIDLKAKLAAMGGAR